MQRNSLLAKNESEDAVQCFINVKGKLACDDSPLWEVLVAFHKK